jgi:hypothetical protein
MHTTFKKLIFPIMALLIAILLVISALYVLQKSTESSGDWVDVDVKTNILSNHTHPIFNITNEGAVRQKSNLVFNHKKTMEGQELFSVEYKLDSYGRRITPSNQKQPPETHLIMLGCSYTFGHGLHANQTLPFYLQKNFKNAQAYNYGMQSYGTFHITRLIETIDLKKEVSQPKGMMIYQFLNFHLVRSTGLNYWSFISPYTPVYKLEDGRLNYVSLKEEESPLSTSLLKLFNKIPFLPSLWQVHQLVRDMTKDKLFYQTYAEAIVTIKDKYLESFPEGRFFMMIHPDEETPTYLSALLRSKNIEIIDFNFSLSRLPKYFIHPDYEPHPSALLNEKLAEELYKKLQR